RTMSTCAICDGLLYVAELAGYLYCLDAATGRKLWEHDLKGAVWGSAYCADRKVYVGTEDGEVWIFKHGGLKQLLNKVDMEEPIPPTPVAPTALLYIMTARHLYPLEP